MPPKAIMATAGALGWTLPGIIFPQGKNILEHNGHKIYHWRIVCGDKTTVVHGRRVLVKLSARSLSRNKKWPLAKAK
jgi:hypothetical protein